MPNLCLLNTEAYYYEFLALTPPQKREWMKANLGIWNSEGNFDPYYFNIWRKTVPEAEVLFFLRQLKPWEIATVLETRYVEAFLNILKHSVTGLYARFWLMHNLPFWDANDKFDAIGFVAWSNYAQYIDKAFWLTQLLPEEQTIVQEHLLFQESLQFTPLQSVVLTRTNEQFDEAVSADLSFDAPYSVALKG